MKKIIIRGSDLNNKKIREDLEEFFNIDILGILDSIFSLEKREYLDYEDIRNKVLLGNPKDLRNLMRPNYLERIIIDDVEIKRDGEPLYLGVMVEENLGKYDYEKDYSLFFDIPNKLIEVQAFDKTRYIYKIVETNKKARAILVKEIFEDKKRGIKFIKNHTKNGKGSLEDIEDGIKYHEFRYHYKNNKMESLITIKIENKKSIKTYFEKDFASGEINVKNFLIKDILDSFMVSLKEQNIESSLMLYTLINDILKNIPDKFNYEFKITTKIKDSNLVEVINVKNGVINLETLESDKKLCQKKKVKN